MTLRGLALKTLTYWYAALTAIGLLSLVHGDCNTGNAPIDVCVSQKHTLIVAALALAATGYAALHRGPHGVETLGPHPLLGPPPPLTRIRNPPR